MENEDDAFYVVRKGNVVAVYKSLRDCQAQVSPSVYDPSVSVYKGYSLRKETEAYLASRGLKGASYAINETDVKEDLFGALAPCPFQEVMGRSTPVSFDSQKQQFNSGSTMEAPVASYNHDIMGCSTPVSIENQKKQFNSGSTMEAPLVSYNYMLCTLEFDGASKGNPGKAGAGAILRTANGHVICRLREGLGVATNNVAEYRGLILGMKYALRKGFKQIFATGNSQLVCMQVKGIWQTKHQNMIELCQAVKELRNQLQSFQVTHVRRELNSQADVQANLAINLLPGQIFEEQGDTD